MTSNRHLQIIALLLAVIIWYYVYSADKTTDKLFTIPLMTENTPGELAVLTGIPDQLELYVKGPQSRILKIEEAKDQGFLLAYLDLRNAQLGKKKYPIHIRGANLRWMSPKITPGPKLEVECEKSVQKTFEPKREIVGSMQPGAYIESETGLPEFVTARGAESLMAKVTQVSYKLTDKDLVGYDKVKVSFIAQDSEGRQVANIKLQPATTELVINVKKAGASREVPAVYNLVGSPPAGYTVTDVSIDPLFISVEGSTDILKDVTRIETVPVDLTGHTKDFTLPDLELINPNEKLKLGRSTVYLEVKVVQKSTQRLFEGLPVEFEGGNDQFLYYLAEPRTVDVTVAGPISLIQGLKREMIKPLVNVAGLSEGLHKDKLVSVQIAQAGVTLVTVDPEMVTVRVQALEEFRIEENKPVAEQ